MANLEVIELYGSPFSERLRWALKYKSVAHARRPFVPIAGEAEHRRATGIATAPVLLADGKVIGDSNQALELARAHGPEAGAHARASVRARPGPRVGGVRERGARALRPPVRHRSPQEARPAAARGPLRREVPLVGGRRAARAGTSRGR